MSKPFLRQYSVPSITNADKRYTVIQYVDGTFFCTCVGWKFGESPDRCKHVTMVKGFIATGEQPVVMARSITAFDQSKLEAICSTIATKITGKQQQEPKRSRKIIEP